MRAIIAMIAVIATACTPGPDTSTPVRTGLDRLAEYNDLFRGKRVGIISNHTGQTADGTPIAKVFMALDDVTVTALFGPEHGFRGTSDAGEKIDTQVDPLHGIPVYSLYGETRKPTAEMLANVDVLVFDMQDVGSRFYTFIWTMALTMEAAAEHGVDYVVLDRPNPIGGHIVEGNLLDTAFATFVGMYPIPVRHGMTVGELAQMFAGEGWLGDVPGLDLTVVPMSGWKRGMFFDDTGLPFNKPSPNMPHLRSEILYPGTCLIEGTNVSEGRGTANAFSLIGAPWIDAPALAAELNSRGLTGVLFRDTVFTPVSREGATSPKFQDRSCYGVALDITDRDTFRAYRTGIHLVDAIHRVHGDSLEWRERHFDRLCGTDRVRAAIQSGTDIDAIVATWQDELAGFEQRRRRYLLY